MHYRLFLVAVLLVSFARVAQAQTTAQVLKTSLLAGHWAEDCSRPPSGNTAAAPGNMHAVYTAHADGSAMMTYQNNQLYSYLITSAQLIAPGRVRYRTFDLGRFQTIEIVAVVTQKNLRVWSSQYVSAMFGYGGLLIRDGKILSNGKDSHRFVRCSSQ